MTPDPHQWIILRLRYATSELWVNYEDSRGNKRSAQLDPGELAPPWSRQFVHTRFPPPFPVFDLALRIPSDFHQLIHDVLNELPLEQSGPHATGPVPLAIFIDAQPVGGNLWWEAVIDQLLPSEVDRNRIQYVRKAAGNHEHVGLQPPFSLPLRILTVGAAGAALAKLRRHHWYEQEPDVQQFGIKIANASLDEIYTQLLSEDWDVVLADADSMTEVVSNLGSAFFKGIPRLLVFAGPVESEPYVNNLDIRTGSAFLWIPQLQRSGVGADAAEFLDRFFLGIIHDYPLHEAVKSAVRGSEHALPSAPLLIADPVSNNSLRFSDALPQLVAKAESFRKWKRLGDVGQFIVRAGGDVSEPLREKLLRLDHSRSVIRESVDRVQKTPARVVFDQETEGLVHMASAMAALDIATTANVSIGLTAASIISLPEHAKALEKHQERHVDITIQEVDSRPPLQAVSTSKPLRTGERYRVRFKIGHREPNSVMIGDVPPVDPLLPPTNDEGYELEVALFEKDFEALSTTLHKLFLPRLGSSEPVHFEIRAPQRRGVAEARIGLYYENNLLQSFTLKANVNAEGDEALDNIKVKIFVNEIEGVDAPPGGTWVETESDRQVFTALDFSQSVKLGNLEQMTRRELSIGFNEDLNSSDHTFMLKTDGPPKGLKIKDDILKKYTTAFRELLKSNVQDSKKQPVFPTYPAPGDESNKTFLALVQELIEQGAALYDFIYSSVALEMKDKFGELQASADQTIQVVRYDLKNVFPWPIIYDYQLPTKIEGGPAPEICLGYIKGDAADPKGDYPIRKCSHGPFDEVYCVSGFWGLRLQIEQLFKLPSEKTDSIREVHPTSPQSFIRLTASTNDTHAKKLSTTLSTTMGTGFLESPASQDLVDVLWDETTRPAVLVVMGHLQQAPVTGEPKEERIVQVPNKKWFLASSILNRVKKAKGQPWKQPNTLVMLMACSSGATEITTLNNFVTNLNSAGAAAVVGTECLVFSSLVGRFAEEVTVDLWNGKTLGEAIKFFNRRLVSNGNPLAFVFNCIGNADLKLVKPH